MREAMEADVHRGMQKKEELEAMIRRMEEDLGDRQATIAAQRTQLQEVKDMHVTMLGKMQELEARAKEKEAQAFKAERHQSSLENEITTLKDRLRAGDTHKQRLENTLLELTNRLKVKQAKRQRGMLNYIWQKPSACSLPLSPPSPPSSLV